MATCEATQWDDTRPNELEGSRQITACQGWFSAVHLRDGEMERGRDECVGYLMIYIILGGGGMDSVLLRHPYLSGSQAELVTTYMSFGEGRGVERSTILGFSRAPTLLPSLPMGREEVGPQCRTRTR